MSEDPLALQVDRLTKRHHVRHTPATVAEVTVQRWLIMRRRYADPFDPQLFDGIDGALTRMPPTAERSKAAPGDARPARISALASDRESRQPADGSA